MIRVAVSLMSEEDLRDAEHLQAYQARMKRLFRLDKFAFVDRNGLIYTSQGTQTNIGDYRFDYKTLNQPEISVLNPKSKDKKAIIAVPIAPLAFNGEELTVCFMEIDMAEMLSGVSMELQNTDATFCNIYTSDGTALSNTVLGGLAVEDNLLEALKNARFDSGYSYEQVAADFAEGQAREVSFTYNGIRETLSYIPVTGTDWFLTYLIRESVISEQISSVSEGIIRRSLAQSALTVAVLLAIFGFIYAQSRRNAQLALETATAQAEVSGKQEELERRIALQEKLEQQSQILSEALTAAEQANKAKTAFLSNMSHEIRTPMNAIIGLDSIALSDPETPAKTKEYLEKIGASADHLLNLINDILDMSRIESGRMILKNEEFSFPEHSGQRGQVYPRGRQRGAPGGTKGAVQREVHALLYDRRHGHRHERGVSAACIRRLQSGGFLRHEPLRQLRPRPCHHEADRRNDERRYSGGKRKGEGLRLYRNGDADRFRSQGNGRRG